jgi:hypothetical protein
MVISIGAAAFWFAVAAVMISGGYLQFRRERLRQETLLRIVEKTGQLDEQQVKALFPPPPAPHVWGPPEHADGRRGLKVGGTIVFSLGAGMAIFSAVVFKLGFPGMLDEAAWLSGWAALIACLGIGMFVASRFVRPPIAERNRETS